MCIIAVKKSGVPLPDDNLIEAMFANNPDGAGFAYNKDNKVHIRKGFMSVESLKSALNNVYKTVDPLNTTFVYHFRIATHGAVKPGLCHPFPISNNIRFLKQLRSTTDIGVVHNGIIPTKPRNGISDTMEYIVSKLNKIKRKHPDFYINNLYMKQIEEQIQSKMVFINGSGETYTIGDFVEENGLYFSNNSYKDRCFSYFSSYTDLDYEKLLEPIYEGYIIGKNGELIDCSDGMYFMDLNGKLYEYDYGFDLTFPMYGSAYSIEGLPLRFSKENACFISVLG